MNPALVRLSVVVALTVPLATYPALAMSTPHQLQVTVIQAPQTADPATDSGPPPEDPAPQPHHDMSDMDGMEGMDHSVPSEDERSGHSETTDGRTSTPTPDRPRVLVLSGFSGLNAVVLVSAAVLRRRDRERPRHRPRAAGASA